MTCVSVVGSSNDDARPIPLDTALATGAPTHVALSAAEACERHSAPLNGAKEHLLQDQGDPRYQSTH